MSSTATSLLGLFIVAVAIATVARGYDVRLVLFVAAVALGGVAGDLSPVVRTFLTTLSSEQFVVPICTAMAFAQVLRHSGCDVHLVQLLVKPIRRVRKLMIPGAVAVGFIVNISVISQASTAVAVSAVLVPLLRAARLSSTTVGACLLLGASLGGELLNPGAPEMNTVARALRVESQQGVERVAPLLAVQFFVATAVFWLVSARAERRKPGKPIESDADALPDFRVNPFKAVIPIVPLALLMIVGPPFNLVKIPQHWLVDPDKFADLRPQMTEAGQHAYDRMISDARFSSYGSRLIGVSMLIGAALAAFAAPSRAAATAKVFFEGAGYALAHIVSVIVVATCFGTGIKQLHLDGPIRSFIADRPDLVWPLAGGLTMAFAVLSGSGMAATQSLYDIFITKAMSLELALRVGAVTAIAAAAGRTMSPVAAVVLTCAQLADAKGLDMVRRVALPLMAATIVTVMVAWWRGG